MRETNANSRITRPLSCVEKECQIKIETVMRIRPLLKKERDDTILLKKQKNIESGGSQIVILNSSVPYRFTQVAANSIRDRTDPDSIEYHFNHVLPENTSQDKIYYTLGLPIVTATMDSLKNTSFSQMPKTHLLISMGIENSGKSYTCFGGMTISKRRASQDGLVPRLLDSLFSQSNHAGSSLKGFMVQISMMQVTQPKGGQRSDQDSCQIHDLLANTSTSLKSRMFGASPKKKKNLNVRNMAARFERAIPSPVGRKAQKTSDGGAVLDAENMEPTIQNCCDISEAREVLQAGLSTSQKVRLSNQKRHLYITIQPMVHGNKIGDKISLLDMSGSEKDNMLRNTRGKETFASNQAANNAILNCLQTLKYNSNAMNSESSSSREKLKTVPFRNHKVTMLLNPLFVQSSFVKITLLLAAYPGHIDFQQKKDLLGNVETLYNMTLGAYESTTMSRDTMNQRIKSETSDRHNQHESHSNERAVHIPSSLRRDERSNYYPPKESQNLIAPANISPSTPRILKFESIHNSKNDHSVAKPSAHKILRVESLNIPIASDSVTRSNVWNISPKQQDESSLVYQKTNERKIVPSAPALFEVQQSYMNSTKFKECALDFPGLQITPNTERKLETVIYSTATDNSLSATTRSRRSTKDIRVDPIVVTRGETRSLHEGNFVRKQFEINRKGELKSPLSRSSLENCKYTTPNTIGKAHNALQKTEDNQHRLQENESASNSFEADFSNFELTMEIKNDGQIKKLEKKLKAILKEKKALEQICSQLEKENAELKQLSRETGRVSLQPKLTEPEEAELIACRRLRLEAQNKIKAPVHEHLERVNYIYEIKNQWCMTNKPHYSLTFPDQFQRAPVLDIRDRENQDFEGFKNLTGNETYDSYDEIKKKGLTTKMSLSPTRKSPSQKVVKSPKGLSALRRLVDRTLND